MFKMTGSHSLEFCFDLAGVNHSTSWLGQFVAMQLII